jgi:hypothetical protein
MKKIASFIILLVFTTNLLAQESVKNRNYYLGKSKRQKTAGIILLTGGSLAVGIGLAIGNGKESSLDDAMTAGIIGGMGLFSMVGSIPLFIASAKNKRKANLAFYTGSRFDPLAGINKRMIMAGISISL